MPFEVKIRPIDFNEMEGPARFEPVKSAAKSRFKRLLERQFASVVKVSVPVPEKLDRSEEPYSEKDAPEKPAGGGGLCNKDGLEEFEPSSVCLARMVQNFMEESNDKQRCVRNRCNCFNADGTDSSEDDVDSCGCFGEANHAPSLDVCEILKSLVGCSSATERNVLADTTRIVEKNKITKRKDDYCRKIVTDGLVALGYDAAVCKSRWEKSSSCPAGEYEYVDVMIEGERLILDIDFRSEFEIARATKAYRTILQALPVIFVGKADLLQRIICLVSEAAKRSLKKKGMAFPPWRKAEYVKAKWLSAYTRTTPTGKPAPESLSSTRSKTCDESVPKLEKEESLVPKKCSAIKPGLIFSEKSSPVVIDDNIPDVFSMSNSSDENEETIAVEQQGSLQIKLKNLHGGVKITSGLACIIEDKP